MKVLVTGGLGYIGSHTVVELLQAQHQVVIIDNLVNSSLQVKDVIEKLSAKQIDFYLGDVRDIELLQQIFVQHRIDSVIHFAGLKAVGESVKVPLNYYQNNVVGSLTLLEAMQQAQVNSLIFSSSATVYGDGKAPFDETMPTGNTTNPYGTSKYMVERILADLALANPQLSLTTLRYFNPVGAHNSGDLGESPQGTPNNLVPYISQVAIGKLAQLSIYGDDYPTPDGTGLRDYIHVVDLAQGHIAALQKSNQPGFHVYNLGTGKGTSVMEMVNLFEAVVGHSINKKIVARRPGDIDISYASIDKAKQELNWQSQFNVQQMIEDTWNWQSKHPNGFK